MNDDLLDRELARLRADVPEPDAAHVAAVRRRVLGGAAPAVHLAVVDRATGDPGGAAVLRHRRVDRRRGPDVGRRGSAAPRSWLRPLAAAAVVAATVVGGTIALVDGAAGPGTGTTAAPATAETLTAMLQRAATSVELAGGPDSLAPGEFWYSRNRVSHNPQVEGAVGEPGPEPCVENETWTGADGAVRRVSRSCAPDGNGAILSDDTYEPLEAEEVPPDAVPDVGSLPTDPAALLEYVNGEAQKVLDEEMEINADQLGRGEPEVPLQPSGSRQFEVVANLLTSESDPPPPALRRALFDILSRVEGVRLLGPTTDDIGRPGIAIGSPDAFFVGLDIGYELILQPDTGTFLGSRTVSRTEGRPADDVLFYSMADVVSGVVGSSDERL